MASLASQLTLTRRALVVSFIGMIISVIVPLTDKTEIDSKSIADIDSLVTKTMEPIVEQLKNSPEKLCVITESKSDFSRNGNNSTQQCTEKLNSQLSALSLNFLEINHKIDLFIKQSQVNKTRKPIRPKTETCTENRS